MKKFICLLVLIVIILPSCGATEVEYYYETTVPTFTCVTGIEETERYTKYGWRTYAYKCDISETSKLAEKYINYLKKKHSYVLVDNKYNTDVILAKNANEVTIGISTDGVIEILPRVLQNQ